MLPDFNFSEVSPTNPSPQTSAQRRAQRRLTREDNRYHSGKKLLLFLVLSSIRTSSNLLKMMLQSFRLDSFLETLIMAAANDIFPILIFFFK